MRGSMGALMAAETRAAVARTVLDSFNSDCKAELLRLLQQEKDAKPDTIAIATQLLGEIRTATHDGNRRQPQMSWLNHVRQQGYSRGGKQKDNWT